MVGEDLRVCTAACWHGRFSVLTDSGVLLVSKLLNICRARECATANACQIRKEQSTTNQIGDLMPNVRRVNKTVELRSAMINFIFNYQRVA